MEVTKWLKPSISVSRIGDSASVQDVTRVNAEQSSKRTMRRPTRQPFRGRLIRLGEVEQEYAQPLRHIMRRARWRWRGPSRDGGPSAIGRPGPSEGVSLCGDRATAPFEDICSRAISA